jgi:hypothetical protein
MTFVNSSGGGTDPIEKRGREISIWLAEAETVDIPDGVVWEVNIVVYGNDTTTGTVDLNENAESTSYGQQLQVSSTASDVQTFDLSLHGPRTIKAETVVSASKKTVIVGYEVDK